MNIQEILKGDFQFKQWSSHKSAPKEFENDLSKFGTFEIYKTFGEFLRENDHFLEDEKGQLLELDVILGSPKNFYEFLENHMQIADNEGPNPNELHQPIVYGRIDDLNTEVKEHFIQLYDINDESDLLNFINDTLKDFGEVTHSTGLKNEYEVVGIVKD